MPTYEIEADGKKFQIDAPDEATAGKAFASMMNGNVPRLSNDSTAAPINPDDYTTQPNLTAIPGLGPLLGMVGYNGMPVKKEPGYEPNSVPFLDPVNAAAHGAIKGVPVVGPWLDAQVNKLDAMTYGEDPAKRTAIAESEANQFPNAELAGEVAGTAGPLGLLGKTKLGAKVLGLEGPTIAKVLASFGSTAALTTADEVARGKPIDEAIKDAIFPSAFAGAVPIVGRGVEAVTKALGKKVAVPTMKELGAESDRLYEAARASGAELNQKGTINLSDRMFEIAQNEGLVSPTGRIDTSYPRINEALQTFDDYSNGSMNVRQMQAVRKKLQDVAGSADNGEARIGKIMLGKFNQVLEAGVPALREADSVYHTKMMGKEIDQAIELAGSRAGQFSGSGFENALRTEFRQLERGIIKGDITGYPKPLVEAISKVARGGPLENFFRFLGKAAPTNLLASLGAGGVAFGIGNTLGGQDVGTTAALSTVGAGLLGRKLATVLQARNARLASEIARNSGRLPALTPGAQNVVKALSNAQTLPLLARGLAMGVAQ